MESVPPQPLKLSEYLLRYQNKVTENQRVKYETYVAYLKQKEQLTEDGVDFLQDWEELTQNDCPALEPSTLWHPFVQDAKRTVVC
jgi:hypothetical protein